MFSWQTMFLPKVRSADTNNLAAPESQITRLLNVPPPRIFAMAAAPPPFQQVYMKQFGDDFEAGGVEWGGVFLDED